MRTPSPSSVERVTKSKNTHTGASTVKKRNKKSTGRPKRPLSAYNIFFQLARASILAGDPNLTRIEALSGFDLASFVIDRNDTKDSSKNKKAAVPSVKMGFKGLATTIASKWNCIRPSLKALFVERANVEKAKFKHELASWKQLQPPAKGSKDGHKSKHHQVNSLFSMQLASSSVISPYLSTVVSSDHHQSEESRHVEQRMIHSTSALMMKNHHVLEPTMMFHPATPYAQGLWQPGCADMLPLQGLQGPQDTLMPQSQNVMFHRQVSSGTLHVSCASQAAPQLMSHHRHPTPAVYPQAFQGFYNNAVPSAFQHVQHPSPMECTSNDSIVFSGQASEKFPAEQDKETEPWPDGSSLFLWHKSQRVVSPHKANSSDEMPPHLQMKTQKVDEGTEDQSIVSFSDHFDIQDGLVWNDVALFLEHHESHCF